MSMPKRQDETDLWAAFGTNGEPHRWPRDAAVALEIPYGRAEYLCVKWSDKGIYDYGTAAQLGWKLDEEQLRIRAILAQREAEALRALGDQS